MGMLWVKQTKITPDLNKCLLKNSRHIMPIMIEIPWTDYPLRRTTYMLETISLSTQEKGTLYKGAGSIPRWFSDCSAKKLDFSPNASYYPSFVV
jgi:hypothetical protein